VSLMGKARDNGIGSYTGKNPPPHARRKSCRCLGTIIGYSKTWAKTGRGPATAMLGDFTIKKRGFAHNLRPEGNAIAYV